MSFLRQGMVACLGLAVMLGCSDSGLYALGARGTSGPDRVTFRGQVCVPPATGDTFPVKVLFAVEGGSTVPRDVVGQIVEAIGSVTNRFAGAPNVEFGLVAYSAVAAGLQGDFISPSDPALQTAITRYAGFQGQGPISMLAPLKLAKTLISGDILSGCRGAVGRTRYVVVLIAVSSDASCNNLGFNDYIDQKCTALLPDSVSCSSCELTELTSEVQQLADTYNAGEVTVQPVYVVQQTSSAQEVQAATAELAAVARAGNTSLVQASPDRLDAVLNGLDYASLQRLLILKRLIAFNRNAIARDGKLLVDSDGDGIPDDDELQMGLDPTNPDTDHDGLMDGVEVKMGLDPKHADVINGCDYTQDTDNDRLNDCEERVLGTERCAADSDGDGIPDLVEVLAGTNPLVPEDLQDSDRDGMLNADEVLAHTDPLSADVSFRTEHGYGYRITGAGQTPDGRACYNIEINNVGLVSTRSVPNDLLPPIPAGNNDIYIYMQAGRANDPRGVGISSLDTVSVQLLSPTERKPAGVIQISPEDFTTGY